MQKILVHIMVHILCSGCAICNLYVLLNSLLTSACTYDKACAIIQNTSTNNKLLQFKHSKLGQILRVDRTGFLRPSHILCL